MKRQSKGGEPRPAEPNNLPTSNGSNIICTKLGMLPDQLHDLTGFTAEGSLGLCYSSHSLPYVPTPASNLNLLKPFLGLCPQKRRDRVWPAGMALSFLLDPDHRVPRVWASSGNSCFMTELHPFRSLGRAHGEKLCLLAHSCQAVV